MKSLEKNKGILAAIVLFILAMVLYNMFKTSLVPAERPAQNIGADLVTLYASLQTVSLDKDVFSSRLYTSLTDHSKELVPQPTGRTNPFDEIGQD